MKLSDLESFALMPRFAAAYQFACKALDRWMSPIHSRADALATPWTLEAIEALTDEELQEAYKLYALGDYYPDLPRDYQNRFFYAQMANLRKTATNEAIPALLRYINPDGEMDARINDDLGYLHCYEVDLYLHGNSYSNIMTARVMENLRKFMRASANLLRVTVEVMSASEDIDAWGLCIFGGYVNSQNSTQNASALRGGVPWGLHVCQSAVGAAVNNQNNVYVDAVLLGMMRDVLTSKESWIDMIKTVYEQKTSTGVYRATDGAFGIYRLAPTVTEVIQYHRGDFA